MKDNWFSTRGGGGRRKCIITKSNNADGKYLNTIFASAN